MMHTYKPNQPVVNHSSLLDTFSALKNTIQSRVAMDESDFLLLLPCLKMRHLAKNELLIGEGAVESHVHFIVEGITRSFFFKDNKDISFEFYFAGSFISSYASFLDRSPSAHAIEAFSPLTLLSISHADLMLLYAQSPKMKQIGKIFTEELFKKSSERVKDLLSLSATERYCKLLDAYPQYVQQIPLKYLASYLNITPESLSRIRKSLG